MRRPTFVSLSLALRDMAQLMDFPGHFSLSSASAFIRKPVALTGLSPVSLKRVFDAHCRVFFGNAPIWSRLSQDVTPSSCRHATRQSLARWTKRSTPASTCRLPGAVYTLFFPCRGVLAISSIGNRWIPLCFSWIRRLYPCHLVLFSESEPKAVQHPLD